MITKLILLIHLSILSCSSSEDVENHVSENGITLQFETQLVFEDDGKLVKERNSIESVIKETISLVNKKMSAEGLKIRIRAAASDAIPEIGIGGFNPSEQEIIISIDPNFTTLEQSISTELAPLLAHEMHHAKRRRTAGYGSTLLEAIISEGLADCFAMEIMDIDPPIWSTALTGKELEGWIDNARESWKEHSYDHPEWFFGSTSDIPKWTGYSIGFKLVKDYLHDNPASRPSILYGEPAQSFAR